MRASVEEGGWAVDAGGWWINGASSGATGTRAMLEKEVRAENTGPGGQWVERLTGRGKERIPLSP